MTSDKWREKRRRSGNEVANCESLGAEGKSRSLHFGPQTARSFGRDDISSLWDE